MHFRDKTASRFIRAFSTISKYSYLALKYMYSTLVDFQQEYYTTRMQLEKYPMVSNKLNWVNASIRSKKAVPAEHAN